MLLLLGGAGDNLSILRLAEGSHRIAYSAGEILNFFRFAVGSVVKSTRSSILYILLEKYSISSGLLWVLLLESSGLPILLSVPQKKTSTILSTLL